MARLAGVEVRVGLQRRAHAARQRVHLVRSAAAAAAFHLASIALHAHFLARALQRRERQEAEEGKRKEKKEDGEDKGRENWFGSRSGDSAAARATLVRFNCGGFAVVDVEE